MDLLARFFPLPVRRRARMPLALGRTALLALLLMLPPLSGPVQAESAADQAPQTESLARRLDDARSRLSELQRQLREASSAAAAVLQVEGIATQAEKDEYVRTLQTAIGHTTRRLAILGNLEQLSNKHREFKQTADQWVAFAEPPPYTIEFIDSLWAERGRVQEDIEALKVDRTLVENQREQVAELLPRLRTAQRQASERATVARREGGSDQKRLQWQADLAALRVREVAAWVEALDALIESNEVGRRQKDIEVDLLTRKIAVATAASPLTQEQLDNRLAVLDQTRATLERELDEIDQSEKRAQSALSSSQERLAAAQVVADAAPSDAQKARSVQSLQDRVALHKEEVETANQRMQIIRLMMDALQAEGVIWRVRFDVSNDPSPAKLRELRQLIDSRSGTLALWRRYMLRALDAVDDRIAAVREGRADEQAKETAAALLNTLQDRRATIERGMENIDVVTALVARLKAELVQQDSAVSGMARLRDHVSRLLGWFREAWNFEIFTVQETITVDGAEITGASSITVGKIVTVVLILTIGFWVASVASTRVGGIMRSRFEINDTAATLIDRGLHIATILVLLIVALDIVNIPLTVFAFMGGALAIGIGFGAQNLINNFISGMILLIERPISLGDIVEVEGVRGRITNIGARCSQVRRPDGIDMLVPNSAFLEKNVTNWTLTDRRLRVSVKVGVAYGSPVREVTRLLEQAAQGHGKILDDPAPIVLFEDFGDNALMFSIDFWVNLANIADYRQVASDLRHMIDRAFREANIVIAFPQRDLHLHTQAPLQVMMVGDGTAKVEG